MRRFVKLESIKDGSIYTFPDDGVDRDEEETNSRQNIIRQLRKRHKYFEDGKEVSVPMYRVVEITPWKYDKNTERLPDLSGRNLDFEETLRLKHDAAMKANFERIQKEFKEKSEEIRRAAILEAEKQQGIELARSLTELVNTSAKKGK